VVPSCLLYLHMGAAGRALKVTSIHVLFVYVCVFIDFVGFSCFTLPLVYFQDTSWCFVLCFVNFRRKNNIVVVAICCMGLV
jgi:hypothetical protein